mmetsp:Transcript_152265/g.486566  ORF Transcript_152265/g.486566 Transcript_152265/m.486566 type:complete len:350 (-) Transcript_152265:2-1051(-)
MSSSQSEAGTPLPSTRGVVEAPSDALETGPARLQQLHPADDVCDGVQGDVRDGQDDLLLCHGHRNLDDDLDRLLSDALLLQDFGHLHDILLNHRDRYLDHHLAVLLGDAHLLVDLRHMHDLLLDHRAGHFNHHLKVLPGDTLLLDDLKHMNDLLLSVMHVDANDHLHFNVPVTLLLHADGHMPNVLLCPGHRNLNDDLHRLDDLGHMNYLLLSVRHVDINDHLDNHPGKLSVLRDDDVANERVLFRLVRVVHGETMAAASAVLQALLGQLGEDFVIGVVAVVDGHLEVPRPGGRRQAGSALPLPAAAPQGRLRGRDGRHCRQPCPARAAGCDRTGGRASGSERERRAKA